MERAKNVTAWLTEGYNLFAKEGLDGMQIERLARILGLNKSSFYHYFGDLEGFYTELTAMHQKNTDVFLEQVREIKRLDPDYLYLLVEYSTLVMFQVQLTRDRSNPSFAKAGELFDQRVNRAVYHLWSDFLGVDTDPDLALRYFYIIRDMFYTRISFQKFNFQFLHDLVSEAKRIVDEIGRPVISPLSK